MRDLYLEVRAKQTQSPADSVALHVATTRAPTRLRGHINGQRDGWDSVSHRTLGEEIPMVQSRLRLILVRHGETEWARTGQHTGRTDIPLTELGRLQATVLGDRLRGRTFGRVLSSPLARALETCRLAGVGEDAEISDDLMEWDY